MLFLPKVIALLLEQTVIGVRFENIRACFLMWSQVPYFSSKIVRLASTGTHILLTIQQLILEVRTDRTSDWLQE